MKMDNVCFAVMMMLGVLGICMAHRIYSQRLLSLEKRLEKEELQIRELYQKFESEIREIPVQYKTFDTRTLAPKSAGLGPTIETPQSLDREFEQDQGQSVLAVRWPEGTVCDVADPYGGIYRIEERVHGKDSK